MSNADVSASPNDVAIDPAFDVTILPIPALLISASCGSCNSGVDAEDGDDSDDVMIS